MGMYKWEIDNFSIFFASETSCIGIYAPTNNMNETIKGKYWDLWKDTIEKLPKGKEIFVLDDMNAQVGSEKIKNWAWMAKM